MVLIPSLFGAPPWFDADAVTGLLEPGDVVVIDAAQTAFGHIDFAAPPGGAVLSCPRKTTTLGDGAVLALDRPVESGPLAGLPVAASAAAMKLAARALWATGRPELEAEAVAHNRESEGIWPSEICRMTNESRLLLQCLDVDWHRARRRHNRAVLVGALGEELPIWAETGGTPFSLPIFVGNRAALLTHLRDARIFATALWPDAPCGTPGADFFAEHLVSLPIDQRHEEADLHRIAAAVLDVAKPPRAIPDAVRRFI
jgi:hypothetical protein